jgi:hypothetical protein
LPSLRRAKRSRFQWTQLLQQVREAVGDGKQAVGGGGLLPLRARDVEGEGSLVGEYALMRANCRWPAALLLLCDWGCSIWSCVDCTGTEPKIVNIG